MRSVADQTFYGVYSPAGELEAVEGSELMAAASAAQLSLKAGKRTFEPVTVIRGDLWSFIEERARTGGLVDAGANLSV